MSDWQKRLGEAMDARGITGAELARRAGFTPQYVNSLRNGERGSRPPLDTAHRFAMALGVAVEWLMAGTGPRDRMSDSYPIFAMDPSPDSSVPTERYPSRAEAIALLGSRVEPEVIAALRAVLLPDGQADPGREFWIARARELVDTLRRIKLDPLLGGGPPSAPVPLPPTSGVMPAVRPGPEPQDKIDVASTSSRRPPRRRGS